MEEDKRLIAIAKATKSALTAFVLRHSVGLSVYGRDPSPSGSSGTLLQVGDRYFIATVAHAIRKSSASSIRVAHGRAEHSKHFRITRTGWLGGTDDDVFDVGYIEVDPSGVSKTPAEFLTLDNLAIDIDPNKRLVFLFGFPVALVPRDEAELRRFRMRSLLLLSLLAPEDSIPGFVDASIDIVLVYPDRGLEGDDVHLQDIPHPGGMSGGSIWAYDAQLRGTLTGSHDARFIGIQKGWFGRNQIALGNRITIFLDLLADDYPDLSELIKQFQSSS